jgi:hypothetical protein
MTRCAMCWVRGPSWSTGRIARARINRQPQPEDLLSAAEPCSQFVQLEVWEVEMAEGPLVQRLSMLACTSKPPHKRGVSKAEDPFDRRRVQPFG